MTNYGALSILALTMKRRRKVPSPDEADLRWLIVLETFSPDTSGWRWAGARLIADESGLAYSTSRQARDRLVAAGVVEYRQGNGRGRRSSYRFMAPLNVPTLARHVAETGEGEFAKGADPGPAPFSFVEKVPRQPEKGAEHNSLTSENANPALEASAVTPLPPANGGTECRHKRSRPGCPDCSCDTDDSEARHSAACRRGDSRNCPQKPPAGWCKCRCHPSNRKASIDKERP